MHIGARLDLMLFIAHQAAPCCPPPPLCGSCICSWHLQLGRPLNHFGHCTANVVWVPSTFIHYWWENKCLSGIQQLPNCINPQRWWDAFCWMAGHPWGGYVAPGLRTHREFSRVCAFPYSKKRQKKKCCFFQLRQSQSLVAIATTC